MPYATKADIDVIYGEDFLLTHADRESDGIVDDTAVTGALDSATSVIDSMIGGQYTLPLPTAPKFLVQYCADIAAWYLAGSDTYNERLKERYDAAISHLKRICDGKASLGIPIEEGVEGDSDDQMAGADAVFLTTVRR